MSEANQFTETNIKKVKLWIRAATILPITALSGIFFIWMFGNDDIFDVAIIVGATIMFGTAVGWWWWIIEIILILLKKERKATEDMTENKIEMRSLKKLVREIYSIDDK